MDKNEIKKIIKKHGDDWYYYYNFDGMEVKPSLKNDKTSGFYNWDKLKLVMQDLFNNVEDPCVFDIGCNMALYANEMYKMGIKVSGIDRKNEIEQADFYRRYIIENLNGEWGVDLIEGDMESYNKIHPDVNIITLFCVIYHLRPDPDYIFNRFDSLFPNHKYVVIQGNKPRVKRRNQQVAGKDGIVNFLKKNNYKIYKIEEWGKYQKPVVVGEKKNR